MLKSQQLEKSLLLVQVDAMIKQSLKSDIALINQLSAYIINSGGKRLRPKLVLLAAMLCGYQGNEHIKLATIIEFIHTATLLHDDVVDESSLRRGQETANNIFGNQAAVLTGDFLYSRSFQLMAEINNLEIMQIMADTTNVIAEGEVMQLMNIQEINISQEDYFAIIYRKTAKLFETACLLGAVISEQEQDVRNSLQKFGMHLGNAFQIVDDIMDYQADSKVMGKNIGDDLAEGKVTLPLIIALNHANSKQKKILSCAVLEDTKPNIKQILNIFDQTKAIAYSVSKAREQVQLAINSIQNINLSTYKKDLIKIAKDSLYRVV